MTAERAEYEHALRRLAVMTRAGNGEARPAAVVRAQLERLWHALTEAERGEMKRLETELKAQ